jgi:hypothetical protein
VNFRRKIEAYDRKTLEGLLSYMERAPVSLPRFTYRKEDGLVHNQGTRFHPRLGRDHQLLPALDFLALLVSHIALRYEIQSRSYGGAITTFRRKAGWDLVAEPDAVPGGEALALALARLAVEGSEPGESKAFALDTLAIALEANGKVHEAIQAEREALKLLPPWQSRIKGELEGRLRRFEESLKKIEPEGGGGSRP